MMHGQWAQTAMVGTEWIAEADRAHKMKYMVKAGQEYMAKAGEEYMRRTEAAKTRMMRKQILRN